jgi:hypothetical protein
LLRAGLPLKSGEATAPDDMLLRGGFLQDNEPAGDGRLELLAAAIGALAVGVGGMAASLGHQSGSPLGAELSRSGVTVE